MGPAASFEVAIKRLGGMEINTPQRFCNKKKEKEREADKKLAPDY